MRTKAMIIVLALVLAGVAAALTARYVNSARTQVASSSQPIEVLVAQEDVPRGLSAEELVAKKIVVLQQVPQRFVSAGAISSARAIEGQVLNTPLSKGEQLTTARFELPSAAGLAYSVAKDQIAIAIPVDEVRGISQLVRPGDHVAVFATFKASADGGTDVTKLLLADAKVVAMGGNLTSSAAAEAQGGTKKSGAFASAQNADEIPSVMTLSVTAGQAEKLVFAEETGKVWVTLLPATADSAPSAPGQTLRTVFR